MCIRDRGFVVHVSGVIGFVGLIIPHTVRGIFGVDHKKLLPLSALTGSVFPVSYTHLKDTDRNIHRFLGAVVQ